MSEILESNDNAITTLTLNRPERLNALTRPMIATLLETLHRLAKDPKTGAIIVTGSGRGFCAGFDVRGMGEQADRGYEERVEDLRYAHQVPMLLRTIPKIVIAVVNGPAIGAGLALAMACDMRFAARSARLGTGFAGMGLASDWGASWSLTQLVGTAKARELLYSGDVIDAEHGLAIGLVNRAIEDDKLAAESHAYAQRIAAGPTIAYGSMKRCLLAAETEPMQTVLDLEAALQARAGLTEDHREAREAFVQKRKPVFRGR
jgi:2-(1,2-epoxy-1,2-dihydrophenyl)acetyl-CoA isomerase